MQKSNGMKGNSEMSTELLVVHATVERNEHLAVVPPTGISVVECANLVSGQAEAPEQLALTYLSGTLQVGETICDH